MGQIGKDRDNIRVKRHAAISAVLCVEELHLTALQIDVAPIEPKRLAATGAGVEQEGDKRSEMRRACLNQLVRFGVCDPTHAALGLLRAFEFDR